MVLGALPFSSYFADLFGDVFILGNTPIAFVEAVMIFFATLVLLWLLKKYVLHIAVKASTKTKTRLDNIVIDVAKSISFPFFVISAVWLASKRLIISQLTTRIVDGVFILGITYYATKALSSATLYVAKSYAKKKGDPDASFPGVFAALIKMTYWILAFLFVLSNFGIQIGPLLAGLGIGGIAIAFALQGVLEDLFASFSIYFDKPFKEGDFISVEGDSGTVKKIGIKTTRLKTLQGQELIVSNKELTTARVNNFKRMDRRRVAMDVGVEYGTSVTKLKKINQIMKDVITDEPEVTFGRSHFKKFGDWAMIFEVIYFVEKSDYDFFMDAQQSINFGISTQFKKAGISMAFPTQTVHEFRHKVK